MRPPSAEQLTTAWSPSLFPADLHAGRLRLLARLSARIGPDGALRAPCRSRVTESALTLALLDRSKHAHHSAGARLRHYLERHRGCADPWDAAVAETALHRHEGHGADNRALEEFIVRAPDFTGPRKRALAQAVFTMLGAEGAYVDPGADAFDVTALHPWATVQVTAVKVILARAAGRCEPPSADDLALLLSTQCPGTVWEGNLLIHLSVLHALAALPGQATVVTEGINTALMHQRGDGGLPFVSDTDTWCAITAGLAMHAAGAPERTVRHVADHLVRIQQSEGGWSYSENAQLPDTDCTTVATEFLHQLDARAYRTSVERGLNALIAVRGADGGFPTYGAGTPSEACMTAAAVNALSTQGLRYRDLIRSSLHFLADRQRADGTFPPGWSSSRLHTLFRAHLAAQYQSSPRVRAMNRRIVKLVHSSQNDDGGWGQQAGAPSDAISTAYALIVLARLPDPGPAARATRYLLDQQRPDGSIVSVPDMLGPRPFPYRIPVLADIFALLALGHLTRRIGPLPTIAANRRHGTALLVERTAT
ncbi:terpene cyclase/mutase family protein [Kitasatospora sp. GP82]|uniref:prenyltransferase/squalene oxidase repeat-containing protein n=1 Tax=Kitasatospora sp. GP82 TaxID=3035089 RepID=UPI0024737CFF|nr:terpene cyclase/mutase family protein [Kitasatospora sp. GP82]MDH6128328.1 squalene-hopene/tetraprenyl-beta-curcumene cyclase [Kitasatospora sp. GP82]